ncbi:hypothetical protein [Polyangium sp. 6x1]|uniref:hypothetical protein n=1 Tax=Polyangium sp. 6x1 TaxID=3042689 RepID=UPI002482EE90|nr:hypothetical protein [Polyangium sp. 6x1]MDI1445380.1 hypothetical protein [Polyangium sp. 6x1]
MDHKTYEINNLRVLNDYLAQTIEVLARTQRIGLNRDFSRDMTGGIGLSHTQFGPTPFGVPVQGMDPRTVDYTAGLGHTPYGVYPYNYAMQGVPTWTGQPVGALPTSIDPFYAQRSGLSHTTGTPWTGWNPLAAEIVRQREIARQQYEAWCRSCSSFGF